MPGSPGRRVCRTATAGCRTCRCDFAPLEPLARDGIEEVELLGGRAEGHLVTGLLYVDAEMSDFATTEHIPQRPLMDMGEDDLRLSPDQFAQFMSEFA